MYVPVWAPYTYSVHRKALPHCNGAHPARNAAKRSAGPMCISSSVQGWRRVHLEPSQGDLPVPDRTAISPTIVIHSSTPTALSRDRKALRRSTHWRHQCWQLSTELQSLLYVSDRFSVDTSPSAGVTGSSLHYYASNDLWETRHTRGRQ